MKKPNSKFSSLREKYANQLDIKRSEINDLENKIRLLSEIERDASEEDNTSTTEAIATTYSGMGLTEAAFDVVILLYHRSPSNPGIRKGAVARYLLANGYIPKGKNFMISVDTALRRLVEKDKLGSTFKEGRRYYFPKEESS